MTRFTLAFEDVLRHRSDRAIILGLHAAGKEIRYEALRRGIGNESPQLFRDAIERLSSIALINRRLVPAGSRYRSFLSTSPAGDRVAELLLLWSRLAKNRSVLLGSEVKQLEEMFRPPLLA